MILSTSFHPIIPKGMFLILFIWFQRLSKLRIHSNFNCHLCLRVTEACVRANSLDYGKLRRILVSSELLSPFPLAYLNMSDVYKL